MSAITGEWFALMDYIDGCDDLSDEQCAAVDATGAAVTALDRIAAVALDEYHSAADLAAEVYSALATVGVVIE